MPEDILRAAREEERNLLRELEQSPAYRRLRVVRAVIEEYGGQPLKPLASTPTKPTPTTPRETPTKTEQIIAAAKAHLSNRPADQSRVPTRLILAALEKQGLEMGGKDHVATLSAHLHNSGLFESDRRFGWQLKPVKDDADSGKHRAPDEGNSSGAHVETGLATQ